MQHIQKRSLLFSSFICLSLLTTCDSYGYPSNDTHDFAAAALSIGSALLAGYGIYKLCDWALSRTDEQLIADVENQLTRAQRDFDRGLMVLERGLPRTQGTMVGTSRSIFSYEEPILYELALMNYQVTTAHQYTSSLSSAIECLASEQGTLNKRVQSLSKKIAYDVSLHRVYSQMNGLIAQVQDLLGRLRFLHEYFKRHASYFALYEKESSLMSSYEQELATYEKYRHDSFAMNNLIRACVLKNKVYNGNDYPYLTYGRKIDAAVTRLAEAIHNAGFDYVNRLSAARELHERLSYVSSLVRSDPLYSVEFYAWERAEQDRLRLEMERMKVIALQNQTAQLEKQARELRRANELKCQELARERSCSYCSDYGWALTDSCPCCCKESVNVTVSYSL